MQNNCHSFYYEKIGNKTTCIQDEIPFEIPNSWSWLRLEDLGIFKKGPFGSSLTKSMFIPENTPDRIKVYEQKNAIQKNQKIGNYYISQNKFNDMRGFIVEPGDIIVSCAGTIGEIFVMPSDSEIGIINQALMRIRLYLKSIQDYFILYFDSVLKKEANDKGKGTAIKNIPPFDILKKMLFPLPPENEIKRLVNKVNQLTRITTDISYLFLDVKKINLTIKSKILDLYFGENSSYKSYYEKEYTLGELLEYEQPGPYIVKSTKYNDLYKTPVLTPGKSFILGYTNENDGIYKVEGKKVIIFDDFTTASRIIDFDFKVKSSAMKILSNTDEAKFDIEYLYYLLQTIRIDNDTHKRYWISEYAPLKVKIHTLDEQQKIVKTIKNLCNKLESINNV